MVSVMNSPPTTGSGAASWPIRQSRFSLTRVSAAARKPTCGTPGSSERSCRPWMAMGLAPFPFCGEPWLATQPIPTKRRTIPGASFPRSSPAWNSAATSGALLHPLAEEAKERILIKPVRPRKPSVPLPGGDCRDSKRWRARLHPNRRAPGPMNASLSRTACGLDQAASCSHPTLKLDDQERQPLEGPCRQAAQWLTLLNSQRNSLASHGRSGTRSRFRPIGRRAIQRHVPGLERDSVRLTLSRSAARIATMAANSGSQGSQAAICRTATCSPSSVAATA